VLAVLAAETLHAAVTPRLQHRLGTILPLTDTVADLAGDNLDKLRGEMKGMMQ